ncbi:MAG: LysR family transcriptional regulator [Rhizomicrobium sp.]
MPVELRHLRYAIAADKHHSFRRAAAALRLKQSTLSRRIHQLEDELGVLLFARHSGGARPTAAGREFLRRAEHITEEVQAMIALAMAESRGEAGGLRVGFYISLSAGHLRACLLDYVARYPEVTVNTVEGSRVHLFAELQGGALDIAIVSGESELRASQVLPLWAERIMVALPQTHPLSARKVIYWTDLKRERFLLSSRDPGPEIKDYLMAKLAAPGDRPLVVCHDISRENILSIVGAGRGVSLLCEACTGTSYPGVVYREVREGNGPSRIGQSAYWRGDNENPALLRFVALLKERYPSLDPA